MVIFAIIPIVEETNTFFWIMADETKVTEKVYCYDHPAAYNQGNNAALCAALMNRQNDNPMEAAAFMGGGFGANQWMNNPFAYMMMMAVMREFGYGNNGYGNGQNAQNIEMQNQLQAIRSQLQDNQNSNLLMDAVKGNAAAVGQLASNLNCDFNTLNSAVCSVKAAVDNVAGITGFSAERVINAAERGDANVIQALQTCCCNTQTSIASLKSDLLLQNCQQTNALQNGQQGIINTLTQGFAATNYERQKQTCDILQAGEKNTQRIVDVLNQHWQADLQQRYNDARLELSQQRQNAELIAALKTTTTATA